MWNGIYLSKFNNKNRKHCVKYVQSETKNKFCKTKCVILNFCKCVHFLLFLLLSTLWIYHFYCFPISFLLLYLSFHLDSVHHHHDFPYFLDFHPDFKKIVTLVKKRTLSCITLGTKSLLTSSETSSEISPKTRPWSA